MAISSIHIAKAIASAIIHNSRDYYSKSVVFFDEENELWNDSKTAYKIYKEELAKRTLAYTKRTKQKLQKTAVTHLSAVINLEQHHTLKDLEKIKDELEKIFDTKVFQMAIHRDEGKIKHKKTGEYLVSGIDFFYNPDDKKYYTKKDKNIYSNELNINEFVIQKNYHAHIEMMGLDSQGQAIRQKMNMYKLSQLQDFTAETLKMQRGNNNVEVVKENGVEKVKRKTTRNKKRLDTHPYKASKKVENELKKILKKEIGKKVYEDIERANKEIIQANENISKSNEDKKKLKEELAELKKANNQFRAELKEYEAERAEYKKQEELNKQLQEDLKANKIELDEALEQIENLKKDIFENKKLKEKVAELENVIQEKNEELDHYGYREKLDENKELKRENKELKKELFIKNEENEKLNDEIDYYKSQLKALEQVIDFMKHQNNNEIEYHQENNLTP